MVFSSLVAVFLVFPVPPQFEVLPAFAADGDRGILQVGPAVGVLSAIRAVHLEAGQGRVHKIDVVSAFAADEGLLLFQEGSEDGAASGAVEVDGAEDALRLILPGFRLGGGSSFWACC
jgi:hypothetical protein